MEQRRAAGILEVILNILRMFWKSLSLPVRPFKRLQIAGINNDACCRSLATQETEWASHFQRCCLIITQWSTYLSPCN